MNPWLETILIVLRSPTGRVGVGIVLTVVVVALVAPLISPFNPLELHWGDQLKGPSWQYWLGTDEMGRDILSRVLYGARISLSVSVEAVTLAMLVGVVAGILAGYLGGWVDTITMRLLDCLLAFPALLLGIGLLAVLGPGSTNAMLAVAIVGIPAFARISRAITLSEKAKEYITAARSMGATESRIMFRAVLPNCVPALLVQITVSTAAAILLEASLSFLGLGVRPPQPSWGSMVSTGRAYLTQAPWYGIFPGLAMTVLVLGMNFTGDALHAALDPRRRHLVK